MKRKSIIFFLMLIAVNCFAQKIETVFEGSISYWNNPDPYEGTSAYVDEMLVYDDVIILYANLNYGSYGDFFKIENNKITDILDNNPSIMYLGSEVYGYLPSGLIYGFIGMGESENEVSLYIENNDKSWHVNGDFRDFRFNRDRAYITDNRLIVYGDFGFCSLILNDDGSYVYNDCTTTKDYLDKNKDMLGFDFDEYSFSETYSSSTTERFWWKIYDRNDFILKDKKYEQFSNLDDIHYNVLGADSKGMIYFLKTENENGEYDSGSFEFLKPDIAVLDIWTNSVYFYEDFDKNEWTPDADENGKMVIQSVWTVSPDGNVYFTDYHDGKLFIRRINNRWYSDLGINSRHIGRFTTNHIPLYKSPSSSAENDGFNFENDIVWEKETKGEWSRIQKLDGREGWVQTKYINFDDKESADSVNKTALKRSSYNVAVNKIMQTNDNLRLRKEEATSSEVITTMLKGTKVKILKLGKEETIDGIKSCWVQVEVQEGGKDKNGKPIAAGTKGWCYGGYLE